MTAPHGTTELDPRTRRLLEAPIVPTLLRLAAPNVLVMVAQASVGLIETYFVGKLGTDALAGMALVFPIVMLMQMTSSGAMGGGRRRRRDSLCPQLRPRSVPESIHESAQRRVRRFHGEPCSPRL